MRRRTPEVATSPPAAPHHSLPRGRRAGMTPSVVGCRIGCCRHRTEDRRVAGPGRRRRMRMAIAGGSERWGPGGDTDPRIPR